jgi:hypothetical protein
MDEHVTPQLQKALKQRADDIVVWRVGDPGAPPFGSSDPDILLWCEAHAFLLVTNNRHTMPVHLQVHLAAGHHIPGIFIIKTSTHLGQLIDELELIWATYLQDEYADTIRFLPIS